MTATDLEQAGASQASEEEERKHIVLKFGGSAIGTPEKIRKVAGIIKRIKEETQAQISVVFSAFGRVRDEEGTEIIPGTTDELTKAAEQARDKEYGFHSTYQAICQRHLDAVKDLFASEQSAHVEETVRRALDDLGEYLRSCYQLQELSARILDSILSFGERLSGYIIAEFLKTQGIQTEYLNTTRIIRTDNQHGAAEVDFDSTNTEIQRHYQGNNALQAITGFIARSQEGKVSTLGRGGSDYTAAIFGAALGAQEIQIWTDVDGVMTCDPRRVKKAFSIKHLSYEEAMEMSGFGAGVVYFPTMIPAMESQIPLRIMNAMNPSFRGTVIGPEAEEDDGVIKGISAIPDAHVMTLKGPGLRGQKGIAARLFKALEEAGTNVILISQACSENTISFAVHPDESKQAKTMIEAHFGEKIERGLVDPLKVEEDLSIIAIVGDRMHQRQGVAWRFFRTLSSNGINLGAFTQGTSERNISAVIEKRHLTKALTAVHDEFFVAEKTLNLFIIGTGSVGGTLVRQISKHHHKIAKKERLDLKIVGTANSKEMNWNFETGIIGRESDPNQTFTEPSDIQEWVRQVLGANLANSIVIDCTANPKVAAQTATFLANSVAVVAANKHAMTQSMAEWYRILEAERAGNTHLVYETNVGAGLPIIRTLEGLVKTGDKIHSIVAVASGTLSYLFNAYDGTKPFSQLVREAQEAGNTEPDPREDLSGMDVARKLLILARIAGMELELDDIVPESLLDEACKQAPTTEAFFETLEQRDGYFEELFRTAQKEGKCLRYIAELREGKVTVGLHAVEKEHPAARLTGTENLYMFTTDRYQTIPVTISGPGAGKAVTASGVLDGIIAIGKGMQ